MACRISMGFLKSPVDERFYLENPNKIQIQFNSWQQESVAFGFGKYIEFPIRIGRHIGRVDHVVSTSIAAKIKNTQ